VSDAPAWDDDRIAGLRRRALHLSRDFRAPSTVALGLWVTTLYGVGQPHLISALSPDEVYEQIQDWIDQQDPPRATGQAPAFP